jgi:FkbM family methyltransferase
MNPFTKLITRDYKKSYSQCGEDMIVDFVLSCLRIKKPTYLDIGAHHPTYLSNTSLFYQRGCRGVCIEPDPVLYKRISAKRSKDVCLNVGIGVNAQTEADFFIMSSKSLNTLSKEEAESLSSSTSQRIEKIIKVPLVPVNDIVDQYFPTFPNFISLDVEGLELEILRTFNFDKYRPQVFCIETLSYTENNSEKKDGEIIEFMIENDYINYADTYINTIFVDKQTWFNR